MRFESKQIKGKGRGKLLGFPTINLEIPGSPTRSALEDEFILKDGIYAVYVWVNGKKYKGAMHFGPIPTFNEKEKSLEVFLIDAPGDFIVNEEEKIEVWIKDYLREIRNFETKEKLRRQIRDDVKKTSKLLSKNFPS